MRLICNLSMMGPKPTGMGVYAQHCLYGLGERFELDLIAGSGALPRGKVLFRAPSSLAIDGGRLAAARRLLWLRSLRFDPDEAVVYSPTQHGLPGQEGQIVTVHDLIHLHYPANYWYLYVYCRFVLPRLLKKCRAVVTVSEVTRQDIARSYGYPLERIYVVPNGVNTSAFWPDPSARPEDPFLLMVGGRHPHKNVLEVLAMSDYWQRDYRLVVTSCDQGAYRQILERQVQARGLSGRVEFRGYLSSEELLRLYQGASALLYPSRLEGFGIPPLEAFACGTPVIASDIPIFREVLGDAALFVRLGDCSSWGEAFARLSDPVEVSCRLQRGAALLEKFTWAHAVDALERALLCVEPRLESLRRSV